MFNLFVFDSLFYRKHFRAKLGTSTPGYHFPYCTVETNCAPSCHVDAHDNDICDHLGEVAVPNKPIPSASSSSILSNIEEVLAAGRVGSMTLICAAIRAGSI